MNVKYIYILRRYQNETLWCILKIGFQSFSQNWDKYLIVQNMISLKTTRCNMNNHQQKSQNNVSHSYQEQARKGPQTS
jgi:hypothetical protein